MKNMQTLVVPLLFSALGAGWAASVSAQQQQPMNHTTPAKDPGVRAGSIGSGQPLSTLSGAQLQYFHDGFDRFIEIDSVSGNVAGEPGRGLGGFNATSCGACHSQPFAGGTSPSMGAFPFIGLIRKSRQQPLTVRTTPFRHSSRPTARCAKRVFLSLSIRMAASAKRRMAACIRSTASPVAAMRLDARWHNRTTSRCCNWAM